MDEQESLRTMLRQTVEAEELRQTLEAMGLEATYANAIQFQMVKKAAGGDLSAAVVRVAPLHISKDRFVANVFTAFL